jgi:site-specific DNA-methyltransferase (adenine-specific)
MLARNDIHVMDSLDGMKKLADESVDMLLTSPPYWALRDYGVDGQIGLEESYEKYLERLLRVFDEAYRVLKKTGTCWVNFGDTYAGSWGNYAPYGITNKQRVRTEVGKRWKRNGSPGEKTRPSSSLKQSIQPKSLCMIPERFALEMLKRGWILRNKIIWYKPNHMPCSVNDRFTNSWEYLFMFVKSKKYYFNLDAVRVPHASLQKANKARNRKSDTLQSTGNSQRDFWTVPSETRSKGAIIGKNGVVQVPGGQGWTGHPPGGQARIIREQDPRWLSPGGKNPGDVIKVSGGTMLDQGLAWKRGGYMDWLSTKKAQGNNPQNPSYHSHIKSSYSDAGDYWNISSQPFKGAHFAVFPERLCERPILAGCPKEVCAQCGNPRLFRKARCSTEPRKEVFPCGCNAEHKPGLVLDPFMGAGTTAVVAKKLGRDYIGFDLNPDYVALAKRRIENS